MYNNPIKSFAQLHIDSFDQAGVKNSNQFRKHPVKNRYCHFWRYHVATRDLFSLVPQIVYTNYLHYMLNNRDIINAVTRNKAWDVVSFTTNPFCLHEVCVTLRLPYRWALSADNFTTLYHLTIMETKRRGS